MRPPYLTRFSPCHTLFPTLSEGLRGIVVASEEFSGASGFGTYIAGHTCDQEHVLSIRHPPAELIPITDPGFPHVLHPSLASPMSLAQAQGQGIASEPFRTVLHELLADQLPRSVFPDHRFLVTNSSNGPLVFCAVACWTALRWAAAHPGTSIQFLLPDARSSSAAYRRLRGIVDQFGSTIGLGLDIEYAHAGRVILFTNGTWCRITVPETDHRTSSADFVVAALHLPELHTAKGQRWLEWWQYSLLPSLSPGAPMLILFTAEYDHFLRNAKEIL